METIYNLSNEGLIEIDKFLFEIKRHVAAGMKIDPNYKDDYPFKYSFIKKVEDLLIKEYLITSGYADETWTEIRYRLTPKGENILSLHGGLSFYILSQRFQNESLKLTRTALKQNKIATYIAAGSLMAFVIFQIWNLWQC